MIRHDAETEGGAGLARLPAIQWMQPAQLREELFRSYADPVSFRGSADG